jgi:enterochelin esterase-like enzyme
MVLRNAFKSSRISKSSSPIVERHFDGHRVDVLLPKSLTSTTPVLVMHDGMNVFFNRFASTGETWQVIESLAAGRIVGDPLVIAVWGEGGTKKFNPRRVNEFLCDDIFAKQPELWETLNPLLTPPSREFRGNYFIDLISDEILPTVLSEFGIEHKSESTALAGCSIAGVSSIYALTRRPEIFGAAFGFSSHWEFGGRELIDELANRLGSVNGRFIWSDAGTEGLDSASQPLNQNFGQQLAEGGWQEHLDYETPTFWGTGHNESFWARRFEYPVNLWLRKIQDAVK